MKLISYIAFFVLFSGSYGQNCPENFQEVAGKISKCLLTDSVEFRNQFFFTFAQVLSVISFDHEHFSRHILVFSSDAPHLSDRV